MELEWPVSFGHPISQCCNIIPGNWRRRDGLSIDQTFEESHSAKRPGRPVFNELVTAIEKGRINALLAWSPNRISRNAIDTGIIIDLMDREKLLEIRTPSQTYRNTPNDEFLLGLFCGQAKLENDNKGIDVKRGLRTKVEQGIYPAPAPLGYMNDKFAERGNKTILPDPERFDLVRKMFDLMLTGRYTPPQILAIATDQWGFRTPRGNKMSRSNIYNIFTRPFYYGRFEYPVGSGTWYTGAHKPMITEAEYHHIQFLLRGSPRPKARRERHQFPFRGPLRCGECRAMITAEKKVKRQQNGNVHEYVYYHCTKRKDPTCSQSSIREEQLDEKIEALLAEIEIPEPFRVWGLDYLASRRDVDIADRQRIADTLQRSIAACEKKIDVLIDLRVNGELTEQEFADRKLRLSEERDGLRQSIVRLESDPGTAVERADRLFSFAQHARSRFSKGDAQAKRAIFAELGSNLVLRDKKVIVEGNIWFRPLRSLAREVHTIHRRLEPRKTRMPAGRLAALYANNPRMLAAGHNALRGSGPGQKHAVMSCSGTSGLSWSVGRRALGALSHHCPSQPCCAGSFPPVFAAALRW